MPPRLFVSYSHDSEAHKERVLALADQLRRDGVDVLLDRYEGAVPEYGWIEWMDRSIGRADFVAVVPSPAYGAKLDREVPEGVGRGIKWEGAIIRNEVYLREMQVRGFLVLCFEKADHRHVPHWLAGAARYDVLDDRGCLRHDQYEKILRHVLNRPSVPPPPVGAPPPLPPAARPVLPGPAPAPRPPPQIELSRLPGVGKEFVARDAELGLLDKALADDHCRVVCLDAPGGVGKTALVHRWLKRLQDDDWRGIERVFAWSFYSQGTSDTRVASSDGFFDEALRWFGHAGELPRDPADRGRLLAGLVARRPTVLILDGLEPLQHPPGPQGGKLRDPALRALLVAMACGGTRLCVVTTRQAVADIAGRSGVQSHPLKALQPADGADLLRRLDVNGTQNQLEEASRELRGHALTLTLLGHYLRIVLDGDMRRRGDADILDPNVPQAEHAGRAMDAYVRWFSREKKQVEVVLLRLFGLFDRPIDRDVLSALLRPPPIKGLTEPLVGLDKRALAFALDHLRSVGLVLSGRADDPLDAHPLVREHFARRLEEESPKAWREAHERIYRHLAASAAPLPATLEAMQPLFAAVAHGCRAGLHQEVYDEVYRRRICRGNDAFQTKKLGAFGADLAAIAGFFEGSWTVPVAELRQDDRSWLLNEAGFCLRALGQLREALAPMRAGLDMDVTAENWKNAAIAGSNLSEIQVTLGDLADAIAMAEQAVDHADRSRDEFQRMARRGMLADAFHQAGRLGNARTLFEKAEAMQAEREPQHPRLYSVGGYGYCDLLLRPAEPLAWGQTAPVGRDAARRACNEARERAAQTLEWVSPRAWLLDIGLDHLTLGRAHLGLWRLAAQAGGKEKAEGASHLPNARTHLDEAVARLREAGQTDYLLRGLLPRGALRRLAGECDAARADLDEAFEIAEQGEMRLHLCDAHLGRAWLALAEGAPAGARKHAGAARALIAATGYHRRDEELAAVEAAIRLAVEAPVAPGGATPEG